MTIAPLPAVTTRPPTSVHGPGNSSTPMSIPSKVEVRGPSSMTAETERAGTYFIEAMKPQFPAKVHGRRRVTQASGQAAGCACWSNEFKAAGVTGKVEDDAEPELHGKPAGGERKPAETAAKRVGA